MPIKIKPIQQTNKLREYARKFQQEFSAALDEIGKGAKKDLDNYVADWKPENKPTFTIVRTPQTVSIKATKAKIFGFVDKGTQPHPISPKLNTIGRLRRIVRPNQSPQPLRFRTGYQPKTRPNNLNFRGSGKATGGWVSKKTVMHKGSKPRNVSRIIANKWKKEGRAVLRRRLGFKRLAR